MNARFVKQLIPIFLASFVAWIYVMTTVPLGYMYNTYPGMEGQVMMIATVPGILAMILIEKLGKKVSIVFSMLILLLGGLMIRFLGDAGIHYAIFGSALTGFAAGTVPTINYAALAEITPENMRDKVTGWCDAVCTVGIAVTSFLGGILAQNGDWTRAYSVYYAIIPILILILVLFPAEDRLRHKTRAGETEKIEEPQSSFLPKCIIALIVIKLVSGLFYASFGLFCSDYIINELALGSSVMVGTISTVMQVAGAVSSALVFVWMKGFKGFSTLATEILMGVFLFVAVLLPTVPGVFVSCIFILYGVNSHHSSYSTVMAMAPKGKAVGLAAGWFTAATFLGENLCGYVAPWAAGIVFGSSSPSNCLRISGIMCIVIGIVSVPFFRKAYSLAFPKANMARKEG